MNNLFKTPSSRKKVIIFIGDLLLLTLCFLFILNVYNYLKVNSSIKFLKFPFRIYSFYISIIIYLVIFYIFELYDIPKRSEKLRLFTNIFLVSMLSFLIIFSLAKLLIINKTSMIYLLFFHLFSVVLMFSWRQIILSIFFKKGIFNKNFLFIGNDYLTKDLIKVLSNANCKICGLLSFDDAKFGKEIDSLKIVSTGKNLGNVIRSKKINTLILATNTKIPLELIKKVYKYKFKGVEFYSSEYYYEILTRRVPINNYIKNKTIPFPNLDIFINPVFKNIKRLLDIFLALIGLICTFPFFIITALIIKLVSKGPIFYLQERLGFQEKPFKLIKFRTMIHNAEGKSGPQWAKKG